MDTLVSLWLEAILKVEQTAAQNGTLPLIEKWTLVPKLLALTLEKALKG